MIYFIIGLAALILLKASLLSVWIHSVEERVSGLERDGIEPPINYKLAEKSVPDSMLNMLSMWDSIEKKGYEISVLQVKNTTTKQNERQLQVVSNTTGKIVFFRPIQNGRVVGALKVAKDYIDGRRPEGNE